MKIGIIGGSGLYNMDGLERKRWVNVLTPYGKPSDKFLTGRLEGRDLVFLPRHSRWHTLLPSELNHRANIYGMKKIGVNRILSVSAVGSLREKYKPTEVVVVDQFFDRTKRNSDLTYFGDGIVVHVSFADPTCAQLRKTLMQSAKKAKVKVHNGGTYVNMEGPAFSTRAESLFHRKMGWDVIGMTNYGEARCAREAEICYATLAMVTDYDCWRPTEDAVNARMIMQILHQNAIQAQEIVRGAIKKIDPSCDCECHRSLQNAIITPLGKVPSKTMKNLYLLLEKYIPKGHK